MCVATIVGQAFLWHQIRCMMAVLFMVGRGDESPEIVDQLLDIETNPKKPEYNIASDLPLVLFDCVYPGVRLCAVGTRPCTSPGALRQVPHPERAPSAPRPGAVCASLTLPCLAAPRTRFATGWLAGSHGMLCCSRFCLGCRRVVRVVRAVRMRPRPHGSCTGFTSHRPMRVCASTCTTCGARSRSEPWWSRK